MQVGRASPRSLDEFGEDDVLRYLIEPRQRGVARNTFKTGRYGLRFLSLWRTQAASRISAEGPQIARAFRGALSRAIRATAGKRGRSFRRCTPISHSPIGLLSGPHHSQALFPNATRQR
jgi:hypothetical protein